MVAACRS